jgi:hypothetical protein
MAPDVKKLESEPDFAGKLQDISKFSRDSKRKMDQLEKREANAWEETFLNAPDSEIGVHKLFEKISKSINDTIKKSKNKAQ